MEITDAQAHIWAAPSPERPWPEEGAAYAHGTESFTVEHLLDQMEGAGVDSAILVPPSFEGDYNDVCLSAAQRFPDRFAVMGRISLVDRAARELVPGWLEQPGMYGVRLTFSQPYQRGLLAEGRADWLFEAAEAARVPVALFAPGLTEHVRGVALRHPDLRLIVDHLGIRTDLRDGEIDLPIDEVLSLAELPNVAVKATALPCVVTEGYPFSSLHGRIRRVIDAFGPERVFWGCDVSRLPCTYKEAVTYVTEEMGLDDEALEWIMGRGIRAWIRWKQ